MFIDKDVNLQPFKINNMDLYLQERNNYYIHQERQASALTRHQKKQKISNNEEATNTNITNTCKTPPDSILTPFQIAATEQFINNSKALKFDLRPRMDRSGKNEINVSKNEKQVDETMKWNCVLLAFKFQHQYLPIIQRKNLYEAISQQVSYDFGFVSPVGQHGLRKWLEQMNKAEENKSPYAMKTNYENRGRQDYLQHIIENNEPGFLHKLFRRACEKIGQCESFKRLAQSMNEIAENEGKHIKLNQKYLLKFFKLNKGKQLSPLEKPLLRKEHKIQRLEWAREMKQNFSEKNFYMVHLDEKWFYTTSRRKKIKFLPLHPNETPDTKILSRKKIYPEDSPAKSCSLRQ